MQIVKDMFAVKIIGKCQNEKDIVELFNFGFSKENVIKKYKKDNKLKTEEARNIVEHTLFKYVTSKV